MEQNEMIEKRLKEYIENMDSDDLRLLHNEYCYSNNYDDEIFYMQDLNEILSNKNPLEILDSVSSKFNINDDYAKFNGYGWIESINSYDIKNHVYIDEIIDYILANNDPLNNDDIDEILNDFDGGDDDE